MSDSPFKSGGARLFMAAILGFLAAMGPLCTDLYLPALPVMAEELRGSASQMLRTYGYSFVSVGENIARHATALKAHAAFLSSEGHRRNMMSASWTKVGIGVALDADGNAYVTQLFVR